MTAAARKVANRRVMADAVEAAFRREHVDSDIIDNDDDTTTLQFVWPERPWTVNTQARQRSVGGQQRYNRLTAEWRDAYQRLAEGSPALAWCNAEIVQEVPNRSGFPDVAACVMAAKAALDGIRLAGVLPDDNPDYVRHVGFAVEETGRDALVVRVIGPRSQQQQGDNTMTPHPPMIFVNENDENGMPAGGYVRGKGIDIDWQNGPLVHPETGERLEQSGAFVEDVLRAVIQRVEYYQSTQFACRENALAITKMQEALHWFQHRTADREERGVEGTHQV